MTAAFVSAQTKQDVEPTSYRDLQWKYVATRMPEAWYGSDEAQAVAENILLYQRDIGGWSKNKPYHHPLTEAEKAQVQKDKSRIGATFDNGATLTEMMFLARVYANKKDERYRRAFEKALNYIILAQYANGGWPQFYPYRKGRSVEYASHITYNDGAMVHVMLLLRDIVNKKALYAPMQISNEMRAKAKHAFDKGVGCILKTQIIVDGKPTVWCAQHDEVTLAPAQARSYELPSFSGAESAGILLLLMDMENPSRQIIDAVDGAVQWFESKKIEGIKLGTEIDKEGRDNLIVIEDKSAPTQWARFYDLETGKPFFCDRDGIKRSTLAEIGYNRRNGYRWYTTAPTEVLERFADWTREQGREQNAGAKKKVGYFTKAIPMFASASPVERDPLLEMLKKDSNFVVVENILADVSIRPTFDFSRYDAIIVQGSFRGPDAILTRAGGLGLTKFTKPVLYNKCYALQSGRGLVEGSSGAPDDLNEIGGIPPTDVVCAIKVDPSKQSHFLFTGLTFCGDSLVVFKGGAQDDGSPVRWKTLQYVKDVKLSKSNTLIALPRRLREATHNATICFNDVPEGTVIGGDGNNVKGDTLRTRVIFVGMNFGALCRDGGTNTTDAGMTVLRNAVYSLAGLPVPQTPVVTRPL